MVFCCKESEGLRYGFTLQLAQFWLQVRVEVGGEAEARRGLDNKVVVALLLTGPVAVVATVMPACCWIFRCCRCCRQDSEDGDDDERRPML